MSDQSWDTEDAHLSPTFVVEQGKSPGPFVYSSPHSGRTYPPSFLKASRLDPATLRKSEDSFVDDLFGGVVQHKASLIRALFPRAFLDLNREPFELDPKLFSQPLPDYANTNSARVSCGLGTIPRIVTETDEIYRTAPTLDEALARIKRFYLPYHKALVRLLSDAHKKYGFAILIDCHSMPSNEEVPTGMQRPEFVLGDRFGQSCNGILTELAEQFLTEQGYSVARNQPYAGGYITEHYGRPETGFHALQIEINRALYMDERLMEKSERFIEIQTAVTQLSQVLVRHAMPVLGVHLDAAE